MIPSGFWYNYFWIYLMWLVQIHSKGVIYALKRYYQRLVLGIEWDYRPKVQKFSLNFCVRLFWITILCLVFIRVPLHLKVLKVSLVLWYESQIYEKHVIIYFRQRPFFSRAKVWGELLISQRTKKARNFGHFFRLNKYGIELCHFSK